MAYIEPNSTIMLFKTIPFDIGYNDTMYFPNVTAQSYWFQDIVDPNRVYSNISYQRNGRGSIKLEEDIANVYDCNYMAFKNTSFENKWFYAFVTNVEYINNATVRIDYVLDVIQTWIIQAQFNECFIERQHTVSDDYGANIQSEPHDTGPMVYDERGAIVYTPAVVLVTTIDLDDPNFIIRIPCVEVPGYLGDNPYNPNGSKSEMISGCFYKLYPLTPLGIASLRATLIAGNILQMQENIIGMFICAEELWNAQTQQTIDFVPPTKNGRYTPRNKKLLTYPYHSLSVSNGSGNETLFQQELFYNDQTRGKAVFDVFENVSPLSTVCLIPHGYKGRYRNYDAIVENIPCPQCTWNNDEFWAWLSQNLLGVGSTIGKNVRPMYKPPAANNQAWGLIPNGASTALQTVEEGGSVLPEFAGLSVGGPAFAAVANVVMKAATSTQEFEGTVNNTLRYQVHGLRFDVSDRDLTPEYAAKIDKFFDMFGYAINAAGIPNLHARPKYTYVKTVNCSVGGNIPSSAARAIEHIMNNGIRFWDSGAVFGDFDPLVNNNSPT